MTSEKVIIYTEDKIVWCMGEELDHPKVFLNVPEEGEVVCGYCDIRFKRREAS